MRSGGARPLYPLIVAYIDAHKDWFEVEPICAVLRAGRRSRPVGLLVNKNRLRSRRALTDAALAETIEATFVARDKGRGLYGTRTSKLYDARKMWHTNASWV